MEACQKRIQEVESSLKSFIESISERLIKTDDKIEAICNRIERLESLSSNNTRDTTNVRNLFLLNRFINRIALILVFIGKSEKSTIVLFFLPCIRLMASENVIIWQTIIKRNFQRFASKNVLQKVVTLKNIIL